MSLLWRNTHYRERRKIEEYSSLESQIQTTILLKNLLNFLRLLPERIFRIRVTSSSLSLRIFTFTSESGIRIAGFHFRMQKKEEGFCVLCVLKWEKRSAIYSAPGRANPFERLQRFDLNRCNRSFQTETTQTL